MAQQSPAPAWHRKIDLPSERGVSRLFTDDLLEQLGVSPPSAAL